MSEFLTPSEPAQEDDPLSLMFAYDYAQTWQPGVELPDQTLQPLLELSSRCTIGDDSVLGPGNVAAVQNALDNSDRGQYSPYGYEYMTTARSTAGLPPGGDEEQPLHRALLQRSQSALSNSGLLGLSLGQPMLFEPPWPQRPRSVPGTIASPSAHQPSLSPELHFATPPHTQEMHCWGYRADGRDGWRCNFPQCRSKKTFHRACDLRKHYKRHSRTLYCRVDLDCPQSMSGGGFSTIKDRARHEAGHNPRIVCDDDDCTRVFSRKDNMRDHYRRMHMAPGQVGDGYHKCST